MRNNLFAKFLKQVNKKSNNKGSSVVLVLVVIAFVGTLVAMSSFMTYYNWMAKYNDKQTKINFYSAEAALAEINAGLQNVVSNAMSDAYAYALQNSNGTDMSTRKHNFELMYEKQLVEQLKGASSDRYNVDIIKSFLKETAYNATTDTGTKVLTSNVPADNENIIFKKNGGIILQNIKLMHTDQMGYVTYISTDIFLQLPEINLAASVGIPELENCSIIANTNLIVEGNNNIKVSGNIYGGKEGMVVAGDTALSFVKRDTDSDSVTYHLIAESLTVEDSKDANYMAVSENYDFWTEQIFVKSGNLTLNGTAFVRDDLTVEGRNSDVKLAGSYYGYGDELYTSKNSSAILINGANTSLDFSELDNLMLSGHAYIGARHYDANSEEDNDYIEDLDAESEESEEGETSTATDLYEKNEKDLLMGESLGVKSNQLIYMVPLECMGYYANSTEQYLPKNPITYAEYLTLTTTYVEDETTGSTEGTTAGSTEGTTEGKKLRYQEVNLAVLTKKLGMSLNSLGASYKPVFRKVNGTVLVYYYLDFPSDKAANQFFDLYYKNDKENMDSYIKMYIKDFKMNNQLDHANSNLHLAGNIIKFDNLGEVKFVEDTVEADVTVEDTLKENRVKWYDTYTAYSKKMLANTTLLTTEQLANDIYTNLIVDDYDFANVLSSCTTSTVNGASCVYFENGAIKALVIDNKGGSKVTLDSGLSDVSLIIVSGDVMLNTDFSGLLICKGVVELGPHCDLVKCDPVKVRKAIVATNGDVRVASLLRDGDSYVSKTSEGSVNVSQNAIENKIDRDEQYIKLADLITYENWTKR